MLSRVLVWTDGGQRVGGSRAGHVLTVAMVRVTETLGGPVVWIFGVYTQETG